VSVRPKKRKGVGRKPDCGGSREVVEMTETKDEKKSAPGGWGGKKKASSAAYGYPQEGRLGRAVWKDEFYIETPGTGED